MVRRLAAVAVSMAVLLTASLSHAQAREAFGREGQFILSADRLFPLFSYTHMSQNALTGVPPTVAKVVTTDNQTSMSLLWGSSEPAQFSFFTVPRVGFDYVLIPNLTLGGDLVVFFTLGGSHSTETDFNNGTTQTTTNDHPGWFLFGIAPRVGYILPLTNLLSVWLRGGVSYYVMTQHSTMGTGNAQTTTDQTTNQFAIDLDPQLVISPVPHFGITAGLTADIPLAGGHSVDTSQNGTSTTSSAWSSLMFIGVTAGLLGYF